MLEDLDLVEEEDQFTHLLTLEDAGDPENMLSMSNVSVIHNLSVNVIYRASVFVIPMHIKVISVLCSLVSSAFLNIVVSFCLVSPMNFDINPLFVIYA